MVGERNAGDCGGNERLDRYEEETRKGEALFRVKWFSVAAGRSG